MNRAIQRSKAHEKRTENTQERTRAFAVAASVAKYALLTVAGFALFERARDFALAERGYEAIGGEVFLLALPLVWFGIKSMIRDMAKMAREIREGGGDE